MLRVLQITAFMHLKTVKPRISARKGIATGDTESALSEDGLTAPTDASLLSQPNSLTHSKLRNSLSHQDSWSRSQLSVASNSYARGGSNISAASSSNIRKTEPTTAASSFSRNAGLSPSSLQKNIFRVFKKVILFLF
jgi:lambda repressor-like predicted transcriptional regulator